jgi:hypothetical protein
MYECKGANDLKRYLNISNPVLVALAFVVFVVVLVVLERLVGDVPTRLAVVLMGTVYTLVLVAGAHSDSEYPNT